jgi:DNA-binding response OmpR family regulator
MASVLVVEDDALVGELVVLNLRHAGMRATLATDLSEARRHLGHARFDLVVLDRMLPDGTGLDLARERRSAGDRAPILMLTALGEVQDRVDGLDAGADDYLAKPFAMPELLARVRALLRRFGDDTDPVRSREIRFANVTLDPDTRALSGPGGSEALSELECRLLVHLVERPGLVLSRADILEEVWGMERSPGDRVVDNYILRLRKLVEEDPEAPRHILTVRGRGYTFRA